MSSVPTIPVLNPATGQVHAIPTNQVAAARAAGGKPVATMQDPQGKLRYVPMEQVADAQKAGGKLIPYGSQSGTEVAQDKTGIHPYTNPLAQGLAGLGRTAAGLVTGPIKAVQSAFATPTNPDEQAAQDQWGPLGLGFQRNIVAPAQAAHQTAQGLRATGHPVAAAGAELGATPFLGPMGQSLGQRAAAGDIPGAVTEGIANAFAPKLLEKGATAAVEPLSTAFQKSARGMINSTIGAKGLKGKGDFARGANPGRGYLDNDIGPSTSMQSIADKSEDARDQVGQQLGQAYAEATKSGKLIPADDVRNAVHPILDEAKRGAAAPLVVAEPTVYDQMKASLDPALQAADAKGGFTPKELFDIRHDLNKSLNWGDQSKRNITMTQQQVSGALGGVLKDNVPEVEDLNQKYQDLTKLHDRSADRAASGTNTVKNMAAQAATSAAGSLLAHGTPLTATGGAIAGAALRSIPARTAMATGLNAARGALGPAATLAPAAALPAALATVPSNDAPDSPEESPNSEADQEVSQGAPSTPSIAPETPAAGLKPLDRDTAEGYYDQAGGDPNAARDLAAKDGYDITGGSQ